MEKKIKNTASEWKRGIWVLIMLMSCLQMHAQVNARVHQEEPSAAVKQALSALFQGKKIGFIGDSITDPNCYGTDIIKYWQFLQEWLGITPLVQAISGFEWKHVPMFTDRLFQQAGNDVDAILIFMGTNDFNSGVPIGEWFTESQEQVERALGEQKHWVTRTHRTLVENDKTVKGRINIALKKLKSMYPDKQVILMTPLHRALADFGDTNYQPDENYQNECGEYIDAYVQAVKEAANVWGVPVIDMNAASGLNPMVSEQLMFFRDAKTDQLHPNTLGHQRMARVIMGHLISFAL